MSKEPEEHPELEELEELTELEELEPSKDEALPEALPEAPPEAPPAAPKKPGIVAQPMRPTGGGSSSKEGRSSGEPQRPTLKPGEKRELEQAPLLLRKAAVVVGIGAMFPFFTALDEAAGITWGPLMGAKGLALIAGWIFHQGYMATHGGKAAGFIKKMADGHKLVPAIIAGLAAIGAIVVAIDCAAAGRAIGEVSTLLLAAATFSHIWGYEHGGRFNPIFPLMFLGPGIAGLLNVLGAAGAFGIEGHQGNPLLGMLGSLTVGAGGVLAIYTMYIAMKQAKIEGDQKRELLREHRKAQRDAQRAARSKGQ
jgi:hypothetical protein